MNNYSILIHNDSIKKVESYRQNLLQGTEKPSAYLQEELSTPIEKLTVNTLLNALIQTKVPQIFAESAIWGDGSDWNLTELSILGDISMALPVTIFDNGNHHNPTPHEQPFTGYLLYTPGALLENRMDYIPADWQEVTRDGNLYYEGYYQLYERRLLPCLFYANNIAQSQKKKAFITIPGLGCGQFAGPFYGELNDYLRKVLFDLLTKYSSRLPHIQTVYYDPYTNCDNYRENIDHITYMVRPLTKGNENKPQLCPPSHYEEEGDNFSDCLFFSFVAWDHVSWPGNDFYGGSRMTDDGVKAAATDTMRVITGIDGAYSSKRRVYLPPEGFHTWGKVINKRGIKLTTFNIHYL